MSGMTVCWRRWDWKLALASWLAIGGAIAFSPNCASAQITPDSTLPNNSIVTPNGSTLNITGGTQAGGNLFHSFSEFSVPNGGAAIFNNALDIQNIISRVTGGSVSKIDGIIGASGTANLFLINPNGIIFGPNASLNIGGSFLGTTASSLKFADGTEFSAKAPQSTPLLTVSVPLGLQFGTDSGKILVQGPGSSLSLDPQINASGTVIGTTFNRSTRPVGLQVQPDKTLALVGGDVMLEGGNLTATEGRIELGSIAGTHFISLNPINKGWALGYQGVQNFGNIQLSQAASVDVSGTGGGDIQVQGRRITLTDGSVIAASTLGTKPGGTLTLAADDAMELTGTDLNYQISSSLSTETLSSGSAGDIAIYTDKLIVRDGAQVSSTSISSGAAGKLLVTAPKSVELVGTGNVAINAVGSLEIPSKLASTTAGTGRAGDVTIATNKLSAMNGAQIQAFTFGTGTGGNLVVNAYESVELIGTTPDGQFPSGLGTSAQPGATGASGNLTLETGRLSVRDGAQIGTGTFGTGDAGNLVVNAYESVELIGTTANGQAPSGLGTSTAPGVTGAGGNLTLETRRLSVRDGAQILTATYGTGDAGNLVVNAYESVELIGNSSANGRFSSALRTSAERGSTGSGGNLTLETRRLSVRNGTQIATATFSTGDAGNLVVNAYESVELIGTSANGRAPNGLYTSVQPGATGSGGNLTLETGRLSIRDGARIESSTLGSGSAGILTVNAYESVELIGISANDQRPSGLTAATISSGNASNINIETGKLTVRDGARVFVSSEGSGKAGNLSVQARSIQLDNKGAITATTRSGNGGDITLQTQDLLLLRRNSQISTTAGTAQASGNGGNINIDALSGFIVAGASENNDITANAFSGSGGRVTINATGIYGMTVRTRQDLVRLLGTNLDPQLLPTNDITAISQTSPTLNGTVTVNTPDVDPNSGLVNLPAVPVDTQVAQGCTAGGAQAQSSFIITGRGGLPPNPGEALSTDAVQVDLITLNSEVAQPSTTAVSTTRTSPTPPPIVEATGWVIDANGDIILTANAPTATPHNSWQKTADCRAFNQQQGR
jgi:filamentous hemagglutinin family protein